MRLNKKPLGAIQNYVVAYGGVEGLAFISEDSVDQKDGVLASSFENRIPAKYINTSALNYRPMLKGRNSVMVNEPEQWVLTNYNLQQDYTPSTQYGTISIDHDVIQFTSNIVGIVSFVLGGREFRFESLKRYIESPWILNDITPLQVPQVTLNSSPFVTRNTEDEHKSTDWEISLQEDFSSLVANLSTTTPVYEWSLNNLLPKSNYYVRLRYHGVVTGEPSDWSTTFVLRTSQNVKIEQPTLVTPSHQSSQIPLEPVLQGSDFEVVEWVDTHATSDWQLSTNSNFDDVELFTYNDRDNKTSWAPGRLKTNTNYFVRLRYKGNNLGWSDWSSVFTFKTIQLVAAKPVITYPVLNDQNVPYVFNVTTSNFSAIGNLTHITSDWEIASEPTFTNKIKTLYESTEYLTSWPVENLTPDTVLYVRVRHNSDGGIFSQWSETVVCKTEVSKVEKPMVVSPVHLTTNLNLSFIIDASPFASNGIDTHLNTEWQVARDNSFNDMVTEVVTTTQLTSWLPPKFAPNTQYYVRLRYRSTTNVVSPWSDVCVLKTKLMQISKPVLTKPADNATGYDFWLNAVSVPFNQTGGVDHLSSSWQIATSPDFTQGLLENLNSTTDKLSWNTKLNPTTTYYVRIRHEGSEDLSSVWSDAISFTTKAWQVYTPQILVPETNSEEIVLRPTLVSSPFGANDSLAHTSTDWQISTSPAFTSLVYQKAMSSQDKTSTTVNVDLPHSLNLYGRVRYRTTSTVSAWSETTMFKTEVWKVIQPVIMTAENDPTDINPRFLTYGFDPKGNISHVSSSWEVSMDEDFTNLVDAVYGSLSDLTSFTTAVLDRNTNYYVRVRFNATENISSEWSEPFVYRTEAAKIEEPRMEVPENNSNEVPLFLPLSSSPFVTNDSVAHTSSDWEAATDENFINLVFTRYNSSDLTSTTTTELPYNSFIFVRVRYRNAEGVVSPWSFPSRYNSRFFALEMPSVTYPENGTEIATYSPVIQATPMASTGIVSHVKTDWEVSLTSDFAVVVIQSSGSNQSSWTLNSLDPSTTYYIRMRHQGLPESSTVPLVTDWCIPIAFTTPALKVEKPSLVFPLNNAVAVSMTPTVTSSAFVNNGTMTHALTEWQFASDANFTSIVYSIPVATPNPLTSLTFPYGSVTSLVVNTTYYLRVRYRSNVNVYSAWSDTVKFKTIESVLATPVLQEAVFGSDSFGGPQVTLGANDMAVVAGAPTTHATSDWDIATDPSFGNKVFETADDAQSKTTLTLPIKP